MTGCESNLIGAVATRLFGGVNPSPVSLTFAAKCSIIQANERNRKCDGLRDAIGYELDAVIAKRDPASKNLASLGCDAKI